ncbi:hypothetical protein [Ramlibacter sp.]|uniref:hypothetical protein n=1 Tax=Ramlibacter sp. TaxID=1917967 RepID=UPI003D0B4386
MTTGASELASLDPEAQAILAALVPEGAEPGSEPTFGTAEDEQAPQPTPAPTPEPTPAPTAAPAATPAPTTAPATPDATAAPAEAQGDPRAALRHARRNEKRLRDELEKRDRELEDLRAKAGTTAESDAPKAWSQMTAEEQRDMTDNFPIAAAQARKLEELERRLEAQAPTAASNPEWEPPTFSPKVQEVIDEVPVLQAWQHSQADQDKFTLATEFDASLLHDPVWKHKTPVERFTEAARRTQQHLGLATAAAAPPARQDPNAVIAAAPSTDPKGVGDFRGGGPASAPAIDYSRMTNEQILASLPMQD